MIFINYVACPSRPSSINRSCARVLVGCYAIWKILSYSIDSLQDWPPFLFRAHTHGAFLISENWLVLLPVEKWTAVALLCLFVTGWGVRWTALASAILIGHMIALHYVVTNSGSTFLPAVYILVLFAIYEDADDFSPPSRRSPGSARAEDEPVPYNMAVLKWSLLTIALLYFFTGYSKIAAAGLDWAEPGNLTRMIHAEAIMYLDHIPPVGWVIMQDPWLARLSSWGTLVLECGLLPAVVAGLPITPIVLGLLVMHTVIALAMRIFFFDQYVLFLLFVPWDRLWARAVKTGSATRCAPPHVG